MYREYPTFLYYEVLEYGRKSRTDDPLMSVEEILEKHSKIVDEYARKHLGGSIPDENKYQEVKSSESIDERPEITKLLKRIENPKIKAIITVEVQRLSRGDLEDAGRLIKLLRYTNTFVITPTKTYDLRDEYDRDAFERELKRGNEYLEYYKKIQTRGRLASVKEGNYIGSVAPFGYNKTTISDGRKECPTLIENKEEADIVRMIFQWYVNDDIGATEICNRLEDMNIKTKNGKDRWSTQIVFRILENVHYVGCVRWNWRKTVRIIEDQEVKKTRPKAEIGEYLIYDGKHEPIIDQELFDRAQEVRGTKPKPRNDTKLKNPFSGIMFCRCGGNIGYNSYNYENGRFSHAKLKCRNQKKCKCGSVHFDEMIERVCETLKDCIKDFEMRIDSKQDDSHKLHLNLIKNLEEKLEKLERKEILQWEAQYDPDESKRLPQHVFKVLNEKLLKEKAEINDALCTAKKTVPVKVDYRDRVKKFTDALKALENPEIDASIKNQYLKDIIERIEYYRPENKRVHQKGIQGFRCYPEPFEISITLRA